MPGEVLIASPFTPFAIPAKIHLFEEYVSNARPHPGMEGSKPISKKADSHFF